MEMLVFLEKLYAKKGNIPLDRNMYATKAESDWWTVEKFCSALQLHPAVGKAMFKMMDKNSDGKISWDEFWRGYGNVSKGTNAVRLDILFTIFDLDGGDTLDRGEVALLVRTIIKSFHAAAVNAEGAGGTSIAQQAKLMKAKEAAEKIDAEKLEKQFEKEVVKTVEQVFKVCDHDKNGTIDRAEFQAILKDSSACPEIIKILSLYEGGGVRQWNALGQYIEVNGTKPSPDDYTVGLDTAAPGTPVKGITGDADRATSPGPGCTQQ
jgi:Ca2+-binding EF-hand superfamily protein